MQIISKRDDIVNNLVTFEKLLHSSKKDEKEFARDLLKKTTHFTVYKVNGDNHFAPNKFVGINKNDIETFKTIDEETEKKIDAALTKVIGNPFLNGTIEKRFAEYFKKLDIKVPDVERQHWRLKDERRKNLNIKL